MLQVSCTETKGGENVSLESLVRAAANRLQAEVETDGDEIWNLTVQAEVEDVEPYSETVSVYQDPESNALLVRNTFGYNDGSTDLAEVLRLLAQTSFSRVFLESEDEGTEYFVIEAGVPSGASDEALAALVREVVDWSGAVRSIVPEEPEEESA
jgi:hypothetical protein